MKKMMKILSLALALVMTVSLLAACGSKDSGKQKLIVGFDAEFPPYGFLAADGSYDGFDLALARTSNTMLNKSRLNHPAHDNFIVLINYFICEINADYFHFWRMFPRYFIFLSSKFALEMTRYPYL